MQKKNKNEAWIGSFQGLRFLMVLLVFFCHTEMVPGHRLDAIWYSSAGAAGVSFFIMLSGFVIHMGYEKRLRENAITPGTFLVNRLAHLWPLHVLMLLICAYCYSGGMVSVHLKSPIFYINLFLLQGWIPGPSQTFAFTYNGLAWTLSIELLCYIAYLGIVRMKSATRCGLTVALYSFIALCASLASGGYLEPVPHLFYTAPVFRLADFMMGIVLCDFYRYWRARHETAQTRGHVWGTLLEGLAVGVTCATMVAFARLPISGAWTLQLLFVPASAMVIFTFACGRGIVSKALSSKPMQYLGKLSMPMYLLHQWGIWLGMRLMGDTTNDYHKRTLLCLLVLLGVIVASVIVLHCVVNPMSKLIKRAWKSLCAKALCRKERACS